MNKDDCCTLDRSRRDFLLALGASALIPSLSSACSSSPDAAAKPSSATDLQGVGVQLYMLREQMRADPTATLKRIAEALLPAGRSPNFAAATAPSAPGAPASGPPPDGERGASS